MSSLIFKGPMVLEDRKGYYVGALIWDEELRRWLPWMRYSPVYYSTKEKAETAVWTYID
jgi:hypothetical protein